MFDHRVAGHIKHKLCHSNRVQPALPANALSRQAWPRRDVRRTSVVLSPLVLFFFGAILPLCSAMVPMGPVEGAYLLNAFRWSRLTSRRDAFTLGEHCISFPKNPMPTPAEILALAAERAHHTHAVYAGALLPAEAHTVLQSVDGAVLVDVRTQAEIDWVGSVPGALHIEWQRYPGGVLNPDFLRRLEAEVAPSQPVLFLCRSGGRSHAAAGLAAEAGFTQSFNVLQGFEGDRDPNGHRNTVGGWRAAGLPWSQS